MSIPLDRLYHYIESVAKDIRGDDVIIYHFYPHGSRNLGDLCSASDSALSWLTSPHVYCNDQEPLNFDFYQNINYSTRHSLYHQQNYDHDIDPNIITQLDHLYEKYKNETNFIDYNLKHPYHIFDYSIILHSELNSPEVEKYHNNGNFIPVYYWCHALIARDWFRYAQHILFTKNQIKKQFLIYNRAWAGAREYRIKFLELLIKAKIVNYCQTTFNPIDPESGLNYQTHTWKNDNFKPDIQIKDYFNPTTISNSASADFHIDDYISTDFEVVLETLFDDQRNHLTEKALRPIACGQPFILCATAHSLKYLKQYGFKTYSNIINEEYDNIEDPVQRLNAVVNCMKDITKWNDSTRKKKLLQAQEIADYNKKYFFSDTFMNLITSELKENLKPAVNQVISLNRSTSFLSLREYTMQYPLPWEVINQLEGEHSAEIVKKALAYQK